MDLVSDQGFRKDGRKPFELRKISTKLGVLPDADGSAELSQGNTKVLAAVYGPKEIQRKFLNKESVRRHLNCQVKFSDHRHHYEMAMHLRHSLEAAILFDNRSQIDVLVQLLQTDGGSLSACINAATLALIDAGIPLKDYIISCTASYIPSNEQKLGSGTGVLDISYAEDAMGCPILVMALLPRSEEIVLLEMNSRLLIDHLDKLIETAICGCKGVFDVIKIS